MIYLWGSCDLPVGGGEEHEHEHDAHKQTHMGIHWQVENLASEGSVVNLVDFITNTVWPGVQAVMQTKTNKNKQKQMGAWHVRRHKVRDKLIRNNRARALHASVPAERGRGPRPRARRER